MWESATATTSLTTSSHATTTHEHREDVVWVHATHAAATTESAHVSLSRVDILKVVSLIVLVPLVLIK
jgi:hypothetical protein